MTMPAIKPATRIEFHAKLFATLHGECEVTHAIGYIGGKVATPACYVGHRCARGAVTTLRTYLAHYPEVAAAPAFTVRTCEEGLYAIGEHGFPTYRVE